MAIPYTIRVQLQSKGMLDLDDLVDFDKNDINNISDNLRKLGGRILDPNTNIVTRVTIPMPPFILVLRVRCIL